MFIGFYSGFIERVPYGSTHYFRQHPQLAKELIDALLQRQVSLIGLDFSGLRNGAEHTPMDQYCADHNTFVVENLSNLRAVAGRDLLIYTFPIRFSGFTGLPSRVLAETI